MRIFICTMFLLFRFCSYGQEPEGVVAYIGGVDGEAKRQELEVSHLGWRILDMCDGCTMTGSDGRFRWYLGGMDGAVYLKTGCTTLSASEDVDAVQTFLITLPITLPMGTQLIAATPKDGLISVQVLGRKDDR